MRRKAVARRNSRKSSPVIVVREMEGFGRVWKEVAGLGVGYAEEVR